MLQMIQIELHVQESMDQIAHLRTVQFTKLAKHFSIYFIKKEGQIKFIVAY